MNKGSTWYQIYVRSFADGNNDGIGDFVGLKHKLSYLKSLNVGGIWLMPIFTSPSEHKYDVTDYYTPDPSYGSIEDFKELLAEASKLGIKVIIDLVIHHTSQQHHWFEQALNGPDNEYFDYYIWKKPEEITKKEKEHIERDSDNTVAWHEARSSLFYHAYFGGMMPDLNLENPSLKKEIFKIVSYWMDLGVSGFRLDAAKHLFEHEENGLEKTLDWWKEFRDHLVKTYPDILLVGEVWDDPKVQKRFASRLPGQFAFNISDGVIIAVNEKIMEFFLSPQSRNKAYLNNGAEAHPINFIANHDMSRSGSQIPDRERLKLAASLVLTHSACAMIFYGEELGMVGDKPDQNIRKPFLWGLKHVENTVELPGCNKKEPHYTLTDEMVKKDSVFNHYKSLLDIRASNVELIKSEDHYFRFNNPHVLWLKKSFNDQVLYALFNFTEVWQEVELEKYELSSEHLIYEQDSAGMNLNQINPFGTKIFLCKA